jgi:hypothetical protein
MAPTTHALEATWFLGPAPEVTKAADEPPAYDPSEDEMTPEERRLKKRREAEAKERGEAPPPPPAEPDAKGEEPLSSLPDLLPRKVGQIRRSAGTGREPPPPGREIAARREKLDDGRTAWTLTLPELPPGKHLLTCERFPWVLKDDRGLLEDRRAWTLVVPEPPR